MNEYVKTGIFNKLKYGGITNFENLNIKSCIFSTSIEESLSFRLKLLTTARISIVKETIKDSLPLTIEAWFNGIDVTNVFYSIRNNTLMEHDKGPDVCCMGSILWMGSDKSKVYGQTIKKLLPFLRKIRYVGPLSLSLKINEDKVYVDGIHASMEYDHSFILFELMNNKLETFISNLAYGKLDEIRLKSSFGIAIDLCVLPFPFESIRNVLGEVSIDGLDDNGMKHFWGYDIIEEEGTYHTDNRGGRIGVITARGNDVDTFSAYREARRRAFRTINNLKIDGLMYRGDIGHSFESTKTKLGGLL
jgi:phosphoribosylamine-glycine ligase